MVGPGSGHTKLLTTSPSPTEGGRDERCMGATHNMEELGNGGKLGSNDNTAQDWVSLVAGALSSGWRSRHIYIPCWEAEDRERKVAARK